MRRSWGFFDENRTINDENLGGDPGGSLPYFLPASLPYFSQCIPTLVSESVKNNGLRGDPGGSWMRRSWGFLDEKTIEGDSEKRNGGQC